MKLSIKNYRVSELQTQKLSVPSLRRLPLYHHYLSQYLKEGRENISSTVVAKHFNFDPVTVRKDLALTGTSGRPKVGFNLKELIRNIEEFLGWGQTDQVVLAGCGDLGSALLGYDGFSNYGMEIVMGFDNDTSKIGKLVHGKKIFDVALLKELCEKLAIKIGIISVPADKAQGVADLMVEAGIKGIWNFSPSALNVPVEVAVQQHSMAGGLAELLGKMKSNKAKNKKQEKIGGLNV